MATAPRGPVGVDFDDLANRITLNVAELEGVFRVGAEAAQCVLGYVISAEDVEGTHLHLCQVDTEIRASTDHL